MIKNQWYGALIAVLFFASVSCRTGSVPEKSASLFKGPFKNVALPYAVPENIPEYQQQIAYIKTASPALYKKNEAIYTAINDWLGCIQNKCDAHEMELQAWQLAGQDNIGYTHLTGYYTPVLKAHQKPNNTFRYPLYRFPEKIGGVLPTRGEIYAGALRRQGLEIGYTQSLLDNFMLQVQGSGYVDFEDGQPLRYFAFGGKNGHRYQSIGRLLVEQCKIPKEAMSMQAIKNWAKKVDEQTLVALLKQNESFIFFTPKLFMPIVGSSGVPLVAKTAVASDRTVIPAGSVMLASVPLLDRHGERTSKSEWRLLVALDTGSAIQGYHLDLYQGVGDTAGSIAGYYNHYGPVLWLTASVSQSRNKD